MATKKKGKSRKMDPKLVSSKQAFEPKSICSTWVDQQGKKLKIADLKTVMSEVAKQGKRYKPGQLSRSRAKIYAQLLAKGYTRAPRKKK